MDNNITSYSDQRICKNDDSMSGFIEIKQKIYAFQAPTKKSITLY